MAAASRLILFVQEHPALWNKSIKEYRDTVMKENCWMEIANGLQYENGEYIIRGYRSNVT